MTNPDFFSDTDPIIRNDKKALLDMCLRSAFRYAIGEARESQQLFDQINFAYTNCNRETRDLLHAIFRNMNILDGLE